MEITGKTNLKSKHLEEADLKNLQLCFKIQKQSRLCKDNLTEGPVPHLHPHPATHTDPGAVGTLAWSICSETGLAVVCPLLHKSYTSLHASGVPQMSLGH